MPDHATPLATIDDLRRQVSGQVLTAADPGYGAAVACWNRAVVQTPAIAVVAEDGSDVGAAVRFAADAGLGIGVQTTGHGFVRPVDGMLIVTNRMDGVTVDPAARTATLEAGCTAGPVLAAAQERGLAPLLGASPTVGAVGLTLGGGLGWLSRRYGPASDSVHSFEVVTPNGCLVHASATENDELFRALRGGGGGVLGVVTSMVIDLFPVTTVYGGSLVYPASDAVAVAEHFARWVDEAPDDLTSSLVFMNFPPVPQIPEPLRGQSFMIVRGCWSGGITEGRRYVDRFRSLMAPVMDLWDEMSFADSATIGNDPVDPMPVTGSSTLLTGLDGGLGSAIASHTFPSGGPPPVVFSEIRHLGGAVTANANGDSVMGNRDRQFLFQYSALAAEGGHAMTPEQGRLMEALGQYRDGGTSLNFLAGEARRAATATSTDPAQHGSLALLQARLDPQDLMRYGVTHRAD
ncbi:MAG: FAD-binding protein [Acidimicrobiales bacterium]